MAARQALDQRGPGRCTTQLRAPLRDGQTGEEALGHGFALGPGHPKTVNTAALMACEAEMKAGQAGNRPGGSNQMHPSGGKDIPKRLCFEKSGNR